MLAQTFGEGQAPHRMNMAAASILDGKHEAPDETVMILLKPINVCVGRESCNPKDPAGPCGVLLPPAAYPPP